MVAVLDEEGEVMKIMKRPIPVALILRNEELTERLRERSEALVCTLAHYMHHACASRLYMWIHLKFFLWLFVVQTIRRKPE